MPDSIRLSGWRIALVGLTAAAALAGVLALGSSGADAARGQTCQGQPADVVVGPDETYVGGPKDQVIVGSSGNEEIHARAGEDIICARAGNDLIGAGAGDDDLYGGSGSDLLRARRGIDFLDGDEEPDKRGGQEFDECHGHLPTPDPSPKGNDTATGCEFVANAFNLDNL